MLENSRQGITETSFKNAVDGVTISHIVALDHEFGRKHLKKIL